jgi:23S rRNA pseudouridine2605 synthase
VKTYHVKVRGVPEERMIDKLRRGITLEGKRTLPCDIARIKTTGRTDEEGNSWFEVRLREGRTQQIRKMYQAIGHPVSKLKRVAIGPLSDPKLTPGVWRELTKSEVKLLATGKEQQPRQRRTTKPPQPRKKTSTAKKAKPAASKSSRRPAAKQSQRKPRTTATRRG